MQRGGEAFENNTLNSMVGESDELELAAELLGATNERALDALLGALLRRAASRAGGVLNPRLNRALGGLVKGAIRKILPNTGRGVGDLLDPSTEGRIGQLAAGAGRLLGVEGEGLSLEDQEFNAARQLVRLAQTAAVQAATNTSGDSPEAAARLAITSAAREHAPGLVRPVAQKSHDCGCGGKNGSCSCPHPGQPHHEDTRHFPRGSNLGTINSGPSQLRNKHMHNIDTTRLEAGPDHFEYQGYEYGEAGESGETGEWQGEGNFEALMSEADEEALAAELLSVSSEQEMDQFFGKLFRKIGKGLGGAAKFLSRNMGPLSGVLKGLASKALPFIGGALGSAIPIPGLGTMLGSAAGKAAASLLQSETDHLEVEEREFEMAKRFVRLSSLAARQLARSPARVNQNAALNLAIRNALRQLSRSGAFRRRRMGYRSCPPCPPCPQQEPASSSSQSAQAPAHGSDKDQDAPSGGDADASSKADSGGDGDTSAEFGYSGEYSDEYSGESGEYAQDYAGESGELEQTGESYETDTGTASPRSSSGGRSGRWVRRGGKIVLYGL